MGWKVAKTPILGAAMIPVGTHTMAHAILVGQRGSENNLKVPTTHLAPSIGAIVPVVTVEGQLNAPQESRLVDI